ncbi:MAG: nitroreductase family protein [Dehalococcoidia bacterium]|nr:nitroreductase family protein [Dehalococcoidia bacterium]
MFSKRDESTSIRAAIRRRISVRHYQTSPVPEAVLQAVVSAGESSVALADSIRIRFHLVREGKSVAERMMPLTGSRWLFGSAPHFIIATSEERSHFMLNMGFRMEQMVLFATQQGLGTCWVGGMFSEGRIKPLLGLEEGERVIALTPIGYPDTSRYGRFTHDAGELGAMKFGRRKPLQQIAFGPDWGSPLDTEDSELLEALECARLAPSWANTQPWRFLAGRREVIAVADTKGRYGNVRQGKHYYRLDVGIAMSHFYLAAGEMGWSGSWHVAGFDPAKVTSEHAVPEGHEVLGTYKR